MVAVVGHEGKAGMYLTSVPCHGRCDYVDKSSVSRSREVRAVDVMRRVSGQLEGSPIRPQFVRHPNSPERGDFLHSCSAWESPRLGISQDLDSGAWLRCVNAVLLRDPMFKGDSCLDMQVADTRIVQL